MNPSERALTGAVARNLSPLSDRSNNWFGFGKTRGVDCKNPESINGELNKFMFASIIVFAGATSVVLTYIFIVNRFLRSDEHWNESNQLLAPATCERTAEGSKRAAGPTGLTPNHA